jgi:hypothetical protein
MIFLAATLKCVLMTLSFIVYLRRGPPHVGWPRTEFGSAEPAPSDLLDQQGQPYLVISCHNSCAPLIADLFCDCLPLTIVLRSARCLTCSSWRPLEATGGQLECSSGET